MTLPVLIIGAGGHGRVLAEALRLGAVRVLGMVDSNPLLAGKTVGALPVLGGDEVVFANEPDAVLLVNGVGSVGEPRIRHDVFQRFSSRGYRFAPVIHPAAVVASDVLIGEGAQVMAGAVLQPGARVGADAIINTRASVDHDCLIGDHVHIAPGVTLSGGVEVGSLSHIGTGATVIQGVRIGAGCVVAAGAVVVRDVPERVTVMGVPAKVVQL